jgi:hypothetical protein
MSGGISGEQLLPMALAIGATAASGGALGPAALGATLTGGAATGIGGAMIGGAALGAGTGALSAAMTGGDVGKSALYGGLGGGASAGIVGAAGMPSGIPGDVGSTALPTDVSSATLSAPQANISNVGTLVDSGYTSQEALNMLKPTPSMPSVAPYTSSNPVPMAQGPLPTPIDAVGHMPPAGTPPPNSTSFFKQSYHPTSTLGEFGPAIGGGLAAGFAQQQPTMPTPGGDSVPDAINYKFDRNTYRPSIAPYYNGIASVYPQTPYAQQNMGYADGGTVEQMSRDNALGGNQMFPQSGIGSLTGANRFQNATNTPMGSDVLMPTDYDTQRGFASGGIADLGSYSDGGRLLRGPGTGISDDIPARIGDKQPARLADGEFVVPARIVSEIGQGSTEAGARELYKMMDRVQSARKKTMGKGKFARNSKAEKVLPA